MAPKSRTIKDVLEEVEERSGMIAVYDALLTHLRLKYLPRDSGAPLAYLQNSNKAPVSLDIIEAVAADLERDISDMRSELTALQKTEV